MLQRFASVYPGMHSPEGLGFDNARSPAIDVNLIYLDEHGLVETKQIQFMNEAHPRVSVARITAKGLDFLQDDGGLGAILGVVIVRFEAETVR